MADARIEANLGSWRWTDVNDVTVRTNLHNGHTPLTDVLFSLIVIISSDLASIETKPTLLGVPAPLFLQMQKGR